VEVRLGNSLCLAVTDVDAQALEPWAERFATVRPEDSESVEFVEDEPGTFRAIFKPGRSLDWVITVCDAMESAGLKLSLRDDFDTDVLHPDRRAPRLPLRAAKKRPSLHEGSWKNSQEDGKRAIGLIQLGAREWYRSDRPRIIEDLLKFEVLTEAQVEEGLARHRESRRGAPKSH
jgi:hypothetical protein